MNTNNEASVNKLTTQQINHTKLHKNGIKDECKTSQDTAHAKCCKDYSYSKIFQLNYCCHWFPFSC